MHRSNRFSRFDQSRFDRSIFSLTGERRLTTSLLPDVITDELGCNDVVYVGNSLQHTSARP